MDENELEEQLQSKGKTSPRITPQHIDDQISECLFHRFPNTTLIVCALVLKNGFTVIGESACASPENFDQEIGEKLAFEKARNKIWDFEGYVLRNTLVGV